MFSLKGASASDGFEAVGSAYSDVNLHLELGKIIKESVSIFIRLMTMVFNQRKHFI